MNETTLIFYVLLTYTVDNYDKKTVLIKTTSNVKNHFTVVLAGTTHCLQ